MGRRGGGGCGDAKEGAQGRQEQSHGMDTELLGMSPPRDRSPCRVTPQAPTPPHTQCVLTPSSSSSFGSCGAFTGPV